ncbi:hypothetical protein [Streptomyces xantholiticus]|uniref:hypothetical protein n=1 Tax=Streptomyces xantholiticus TaxID=68285 RepID=UPI001673504D|nr:hypothetical protein [Streptomyces xantholiticus]GGW66178.1 hypothetical protein GCM10010381_58980 [Streptomyces xantholiticus]
MENWQENVGTGYTHEPHEVTIQLDGLGRKLRDLPIEPIVAPDSAEGPVFVDESGRRSKKFRRIGWVLAAACACYAITLVAALLGGDSSAPWMPGLGQVRDKKPEQVEIQPAPTGRGSTVATPNAPPGSPAPADSAGAVLPLPSGTTGGGRSLPAAPASASASPSAPPPSGGTGTEPAASPAAPGAGASSSGVTPSGGPGPAEPAAPSSGSPRQPVQEGAP